LLYLPYAVPAVAHFAFPGDSRVPTGFVQYDQASYMAMAREHWDHGFSLLYGLPFSPDEATPALYAQPQSLLLGLLLRLSGLQPGVLFFGFGVLCGLVFFRLAIALWLERVRATDGAAGLGLPILLWGGGLLGLAGLAATLSGGPFTPQGVFRFDPLDGFWFLNLGRNAWYALEAYYHALAVAMLLCLLRRRYGWALLLVALLSASHPFTGVQFAAIHLAYVAGERLLRSDARPPLWSLAGGLAVLLAHVAYYLWLIPAFSPEQRSLMAQWLADTPAPPETLLLAYGLVLPFAVAAVARGAWRDPAGRLFLVMAACTFALMKHDLLIEAHQPLHFSRGYLWSALLLLGAPQLHAFLRRLLARRRPGAVAAMALVGLFAVDNALWFAWRTKDQLQGFTQFLLRPEQWAVLEELRRPDYEGHLVVSLDLEVGYLATVYTPLRSWLSHAASTPHVAEQGAALQHWAETGEEAAAWAGRDIVFVVVADDDRPGVRRLLESAGDEKPGPTADLLVVRRPAGP